MVHWYRCDFLGEFISLNSLTWLEVTLFLGALFSLIVFSIPHPSFALQFLNAAKSGRAQDLLGLLTGSGGTPIEFTDSVQPRSKSTSWNTHRLYVFLSAALKSQSHQQAHIPYICICRLYFFSANSIFLSLYQHTNRTRIPLCILPPEMGTRIACAS
jgi:hypothetical protein